MNRKAFVFTSGFSLMLIALAVGSFAGDNPGGAPRVSDSTNTVQGTKTIQETGHPLFCSPHFSPIAISGDHVFVVNTPADTVDVLDRNNREIVSRINVGIDPVSIAIRPDGTEVWVSNHISDSVSVIDIGSTSTTYLQVVATIQEFDAETKSTRFDEPVGIAFAGNEKASLRR